MFKPCVLLLLLLRARLSSTPFEKLLNSKRNAIQKEIVFPHSFRLSLSRTRARATHSKGERESKRERTIDRYYARELSQAHSVRL
jgi:hypothetical protein